MSISLNEAGMAQRALLCGAPSSMHWKTNSAGRVNQPERRIYRLASFPPPRRQVPPPARQRGVHRLRTPQSVQ